MVIQKYVREIQTKSFEKNIKAMQESFNFFTEMKTKLQTESQIKIARCWRNHHNQKRIRE